MNTFVRESNQIVASNWEKIVKIWNEIGFDDDVIHDRGSHIKDLIKV
jgi:hypothetical protein